MPWVRIDEHFADHPKIVQAGPEAMALYVAGLCYCNRFQTDGKIPPSKARTLLDLPDVDTTIKRLVTATLWEEQGDGRFQVHDYLEYQPSKEQVEEERRKRQAAGKAGGLAKAKASAKAKGVAKTYPGSVPGSGSDSTTEPETAGEASSPALQDDADFATFWETYPKRNGKKIGKGPTLTVWKRLTKVQRARALAAVVHYRQACDEDLTLAKDPARWLSQGTYDDWLSPATAQPRKPKDSFADMARSLASREGASDEPINATARPNGRSLPEGQRA